MTDGQVKPDTPDAGTSAFTPEQQAHVDHIVTERLGRERAKYADYDATKQRLAELEAEKDKREEAEKSERQKEIERVVKEREKALNSQFENERKKWQLEIAVERELQAQGITDPDVRHLLVGEFAVTTLEEAKEKVTALLVAKSYLKSVSGSVTKPLGAGGTPAAGSISGAGMRMRVTSERIRELTLKKEWLKSEEKKAYDAGLLDIID